MACSSLVRALLPTSSLIVPSHPIGHISVMFPTLYAAHPPQHARQHRARPRCRHHVSRRRNFQAVRTTCQMQSRASHVFARLLHGFKFLGFSSAAASLYFTTALTSYASKRVREHRATFGLESLASLCKTAVLIPEAGQCFPRVWTSRCCTKSCRLCP